MMDYRDLCPEGGDPEEFDKWAKVIAKRVGETPAPAKFDEGFAKAINEELGRVRRVLKSLSPDARGIIHGRETSIISMEMLFPTKPEAGSGAPAPVVKSPAEITALAVMSGAEPNAIERLRLLVAEDHTKPKEDSRRWNLLISAYHIWKKEGGRVTLTYDSGFVAFLDRLIKDANNQIADCDARLKFSGFNLLRSFRNSLPEDQRQYLPKTLAELQADKLDSV